MIVDADIRLTQAYTVEDLYRDMDVSGVDQAVVTINPPLLLERLPVELAVLADSVRESQGRLIGMGYVDPHMPRCAKLVERCRKEYNFAAIYIDSGRSGVRLDDFDALHSIAETAIRQNMPVFARVSAATFDCTHPVRLERMLAQWPQLTVVAVHMGGASRPDYCADVIKVAQRRPNLYLLGSAVYWQRIPQAIAAVGAERVLFGSAAPERGLMPAGAAAYRALLDLAGVDRGGAANIMGENARRILRIAQ